MPIIHTYLYNKQTVRHDDPSSVDNTVNADSGVININNTRTNMEKNEMNKKSNVDVLTDVTYMVSNSIE
jgi:mevalonate kinase